MQIKRFFLTTVCLLLTAGSALSAEFGIKTSFQAGPEYDSNVFKTYNVFKKDGLIRAFLKTDAELRWPRTYLGLSYRLGGKKYFTKPEQDTVINLVELNFKPALHKKLYLISQSSLKYQAENSDIDQDNFDINEDFLEFHQGLGLRYSPGKGLRIKPEADFYLFEFNSNYPSLSYYLQQYGFSAYKRIARPTELGFIYHYRRYNFTNISRADGLNEFGAVFRYTRSFFASIGYTFQTNSSTIEELSFTNHKFSLIASIPIRFKRRNGNGANLNPDFVLSLIGILQFKDYKDQTLVDEEGRRYLLSESEEDNFNILIIKITKSFTKNIATELKFTWHSNQFAKTGNDYRRGTLYLGARFSL